MSKNISSNDSGKGGWGLIAGNGRFPFLVIEGARSQGIDMAVIAIKEEADRDLAKLAQRIHWVSLGELVTVTLKQGPMKFLVVAREPQLQIDRPDIGVKFNLSKALADEIL